MKSIRFKTESGSEYTLTDILRDPTEASYSAGLRRIEGKPMRDMQNGLTMFAHENVALVTFTEFPEVGERFRYWHSEWAGVISTPVVEVEEL